MVWKSFRDRSSRKIGAKEGFVDLASARESISCLARIDDVQIVQFIIEKLFKSASIVKRRYPTMSYMKDVSK